MSTREELLDEAARETMNWLATTQHGRPYYDLLEAALAAPKTPQVALNLATLSVYRIERVNAAWAA